MSRALRVLHVIDHLGYGGAPFVVKGLVERMPADRIESYVCALRPNPRPLPIAATVITLPSGRYSPAVIRSIARICTEHRVDLMHAHLSRSAISSLLARSFCRTPVIVHEHGPVCVPGALPGLYRFLLRRLRRRPAAVIANSQATARRLVERVGISPQKISVVYNAVDLERFDGLGRDRAGAKAGLGLPPRDFVIGFVGRLQDFKGVDLLVRAVALLPRETRSYRLVIVGDGPEKGPLQALAARLGIAECVDFLGLRSDAEAVMPAFDVAVMPSRYESFGMVLLELMRMRVPVISSGVDGMAELVRPEENALVSQPNTPERIADCITRLQADDALRRRLAENAYSFTEQFGLARQAEAIENLYQQVLRDHRIRTPTSGRTS